MIRWMPRSSRCAVCGKIRYATREAAMAAVAKAPPWYRATNAYHSPRCGWWHLTSQQQSAAVTAGTGRPS